MSRSLPGEGRGEEARSHERERRPVTPDGELLPPRAQPGYYPGYRTLTQRAFWDEATRQVVQRRIEENPRIRFFDAHELRLLEAVVDRLLPQDDRDEAHRIAIAPWVDERLYEGRIDGYRYAGMPPDQEAYRRGLRGIDACAAARFGRSFVELSPREREIVLQTLHDNKPDGAHDIWEHLSVTHFWMMMLTDVCTAYYAHPFAWDEIGYGGPAYPRGYMRLEGGQPEPWEVDERRYDWEPPPGSPSAEINRIEGHEGFGYYGQGGTH